MATSKRVVVEQPDFDEIMESYDPKKNVSKNFMTLYEKTAIMSMRMQELANGAPSYIDIGARADLKGLRGNAILRKIAEEELRAKMLPMFINRKMPNGKVEYWRLEDLIIM